MGSASCRSAERSVSGVICHHLRKQLVKQAHKNSIGRQIRPISRPELIYQYDLYLPDHPLFYLYDHAFRTGVPDAAKRPDTPFHGAGYPVGKDSPIYVFPPGSRFNALVDSGLLYSLPAIQRLLHNSSESST